MSQNIEWIRGQTEEWTLALTNADGTAFDTTGVLAIEFEVKKRDGHADPADIALSIGHGITPRTQADPDVGVCDMVATSTQTFSLAAGAWRYDVFVTKSDGRRKRALSGTLTVDNVVNFP